MTLEQHLLRIPHLDLGLKYHLPTLLAEVEGISKYEPYFTRELKPREKYANAWSGVCLNSRDGDSFSELSEDFIGDLAKKKIVPRMLTAVGKLCPYMWSIAESVGASPYKVRVMRIAPNSSLNWHSHVHDNGQHSTTMALHLPIIVPAEFSYQVMPLNDHCEWVATGREPVIYSKRYEPGRLAMFNSFHYHNVFNSSDEYRVSLMLYVCIKNEKTAAIFQKAAELYDGPLI